MKVLLDRSVFRSPSLCQEGMQECRALLKGCQTDMASPFMHLSVWSFTNDQHVALPHSGVLKPAQSSSP